jgi:predicted ATP-grasp superfamily ATP-dependent carboligase
MLNPVPPPALSRPPPTSSSTAADAASGSAPNPALGAAAVGNQRRNTDARPKLKLLPVKFSKLVGIEVSQADLEKEAEDEARKVKEEQNFEEEFVREKRTNRFEWVRKRLIGAKA